MAKNFNYINNRALAYINNCIQIDPAAYQALTEQDRVEFRRERRRSYLLGLRDWFDELGVATPKTEVEVECESEVAEAVCEEASSTLKRQRDLEIRVAIINEYLVTLYRFLRQNKVELLSSQDEAVEPLTPDELTEGENLIRTIASLCLDLDTERLQDLIQTFNRIGKGRRYTKHV